LSTRDDDIEFDFFDEPATQETPSRDRTPRRPSPDGGRPRGPRPPFRAPTGITPLLRLVGLVAFAILVVVLLVFWVDSCRSDQERDAYRDYMTEVDKLAQSSESTGRELGDMLTTPGLKQADVDQRLAGLVQQQELDLSRAQELDAPGPMRPANEQLVQALQFRVSGLRGLRDVFDQTKGNEQSQASQAGALLAEQAQRLVAADVIWEDGFQNAAVEELRAQDISGVEVPDSDFVQTADFASQRSLTPIWQRIHGASTGGTPTGSHGSGLAGVKVLPTGRQLNPGTETTIEASTELAFEVSVANTGESQEVGVEVQLTIPKQPTSIVKKQTIDLIEEGETKTVTFRDFPTLPFGEKINLRVDVKPVPGETNTGNNSLEFPVFFSI
jgi:hypothetical protein